MANKNAVDAAIDFARFWRDGHLVDRDGARESAIRAIDAHGPSIIADMCCTNVGVNWINKPVQDTLVLALKVYRARQNNIQLGRSGGVA